MFIDQKSLSEHCKLLSLAHCRSYVVTVYKNLILQHPLSYDDMEAAIEQCEELLVELNITKYLQVVCKHFDIPNFEADNPGCKEIQYFHNLIKEKFKKIINVAFKQVPVHPDLYYCLPSWKSKDLVCLILFCLQ